MLIQMDWDHESFSCNYNDFITDTGHISGYQNYMYCCNIIDSMLISGSILISSTLT